MLRISWWIFCWIIVYIHLNIPILAIKISLRLLTTFSRIAYSYHHELWSNLFNLFNLRNFLTPLEKRKTFYKKLSLFTVHCIRLLDQYIARLGMYIWAVYSCWPVQPKLYFLRWKWFHTWTQNLTDFDFS